MHHLAVRLAKSLTNDRRRNTPIARRRCKAGLVPVVRRAVAEEALQKPVLNLVTFTHLICIQSAIYSATASGCSRQARKQETMTIVQSRNYGFDERTNDYLNLDGVMVGGDEVRRSEHRLSAPVLQVDSSSLPPAMPPRLREHVWKCWWRPGTSCGVVA